MSRTVARILHGSHLFGTATEKSDTDFKSVVIPSPRQILLGESDWTVNDGSSVDSSRRNGPGDVDDERHTLLKFVRLLAGGQPVAYELLFAPDEFHKIDPHPAWKKLVCNSDLVVSAEAARFLGYCRNQALAYGLKGERVAAAEKALALLSELESTFGSGAKLGPHIDSVISGVGSEHVRIEHIEMPGGRKLAHLRIAGKMAPETVTIKEARAIAAGVVKAYGERAKSAKDGKDWKALSHALRIGYEALELYSTGRITLPRPEAPKLLAVKKGMVDAEEVGAEITELVDKVELAIETTSLRESADLEFLEALVLETHLEAVEEFLPANASRRSL